jgi:hypothetical protein
MRRRLGSDPSRRYASSISKAVSLPSRTRATLLRFSPKSPGNKRADADLLPRRRRTAQEAFRSNSWCALGLTAGCGSWARPPRRGGDSSGH